MGTKIFVRMLVVEMIQNSVVHYNQINVVLDLTGGMTLSTKISF